ncbi:Hypothetical predicted protein [Mytilus galloprovincialis]|uniref:Ig-like domain-containing protein n=1 Tax=Mytilus galloprovincialis TaxID=29158 RepID=A0A8B6DDX1_MYTGA|nr:Hypothetical predicted protein [Mytilus galloprovincialis]
MRCTIRETHPSITDVWWTKGYSNARIQADMKYTIQKRTTYTSLYFLNVDGNDAGIYRCCANNTHGEMCANTTLVTGKKPVFPKAYKDIYRVKEGTTVILECDPKTSIPPITELWWQKRMNGRFYNLTNSSKYSDGTVTAPNLHITNVRSSDVTNYTCNVANAFGKSQVDLKVQLGEIPTVSATTKEYYPIRGGAVTLICNINNENQIWWKRFNGHKELDIDSKKSSGETTCSLTIQNIQAEDDGDYRCYGGNEFGRNVDTITISSGNIPIISKSSNTYNGEYDKSLILTVYVQNVYPEVSNIEWYHKGRVLSRRHRYTLSNLSLKISHLRLEDNGTYVCRVGNRIGYANVTMTLTIWKRPLINVYGTTFSKKGSDATFKCYIRNSYPPVERKLWRKGAGTKSEQTILKNDNKYSIQHFEHYLTLKVKSVNIDDSGTYTCVAENKFSAGNGSIILSVGSPPVVNISRDYYVTEVGKDVTISCLIRNVPSNYLSTIGWRKGSSDIMNSQFYTVGPSDNPFLIIKNARVSDAGYYSCHVRNKYGSEKDLTELKIISARVQRQVHVASARTSYEIYCEVTGGDRVFWRKNGTILNLNNQPKYTGGNLKNPSLFIRNISYLDKGIYTCETSLENLTAISNKIQLFVKGSYVI